MKLFLEKKNHNNNNNKRFETTRAWLCVATNDSELSLGVRLLSPDQTVAVDDVTNRALASSGTRSFQACFRATQYKINCLGLTGERPPQLHMIQMPI